LSSERSERVETAGGRGLSSERSERVETPKKGRKK